MKKVLLTALAAASITVASAQNSAVNSAILNHKNGTLDKAQADIDQAIEHKKTKEKAKTWFYRGVIYQDMIGNPIYGKLTNDQTPLVVLESFDKAVELDGKDGEFGKQVPERKQMLYGQVLNQAVEFHNQQDWDNAIEKYELAHKVSPTDTTAVLYAAYASTADQNYPQAIKFYDTLLDMGHKTEDVYKAKVQLMQASEATDEEVMKTLSAGLKEHPNSVYLMQEELKYYLKNDRADEAMAKLDNAIAADPKNASLYAVKGNLLERKNDLKGATEAYKKAIEADPNNFDAYYNLGVMKYNEGTEVNNKAAKMDYATYQKKGKALEAEAKKYYEESLPYFEKALEIQPKDQATMQNLLKVYTRLNRKADADRINKMLSSNE
ncbi:tetratricopeptide repeat protein [Pontibacter ummariensis]|uniref:Tetratricopeptide repeat-containing protein n=1 Tax=Pontibacter ummariensis TaxID=1610492 RepID=A0A239BQK1_9BACT|nr:tetratricopeptide repeat protein [Pontibacter ummariensis]PRY15672.1 tetratricopeptide repeat protein [Pontibacter ummariensis]SNS10280.1 Tetratricopeptide repeat-containing protein [Pontibacter ummariensis]